MSNDHLNPGEKMNDWSISPHWSPGSGLPKYNDPSRNPQSNSSSTDYSFPSVTSGYSGGKGSWPVFFAIISFLAGGALAIYEYQDHWIQIAIPFLAVLLVYLVMLEAFSKDVSGKRKFKFLWLLPVIGSGYLFISQFFIHRFGSYLFGLSLYSWSFPLTSLYFTFSVFPKYFKKSTEKKVELQEGKNSEKLSENFISKIEENNNLYSWSKDDRNKVTSNIHFMTTASLKNPNNYALGSEAVRSNVELALTVLTGNNHAQILKYATPVLLANQAFLAKAITINPFIFQYCTESMKNDFYVVKHVISESKYGPLLRFASKSLLGNKELVLLAYQYPGDLIDIFDEISPELQADPDVLAAAKKARDFHFS